MDALHSEAILSNFHAFEAEYSINEDTGSITEVYMSDSEEETLECESQSDDAFADLSVRVEEDEETCKEHLAAENFTKYTCKCSLGVGKKACSYQFTLEEISEQREYCLSLERA